jgi:hypothetical protein
MPRLCRLANEGLDVEAGLARIPRRRDAERREQMQEAEHAIFADIFKRYVNVGEEMVALGRGRLVVADADRRAGEPRDDAAL